ncbi:50S ribosomal protein L6 [Gammaproteobacteria bacterium 45_16_T64]|nr:50S ribosomal protein L6 [Gammaproteobacteria bacterium 45_16_T64]
MSRIAKAPIKLPAGVEVKIDGQELKVKGGKGELSLSINPKVSATFADNVLSVAPVVENKDSWAMAGTMRALANNMVTGVTQGFEKKLELKGVGYRAQVKGKVINLTLGFSHPVEFAVPEGLTAETPSQTEIILKGADKQLIGQAAANIRAYRPPEPYKGKGIRYADEHVRRKEAKKK